MNQSYLATSLHLFSSAVLLLGIPSTSSVLGAASGGGGGGGSEMMRFAVSLVVGDDGGGAPIFFFRILITFLFTGSGGWLSVADGRGISSMISSGFRKVALF